MPDAQVEAGYVEMGQLNVSDALRGVKLWPSDKLIFCVI